MAKRCDWVLPLFYLSERAKRIILIGGGVGAADQARYSRRVFL